MLLVIHNLPTNSNVNDVKFLIKSKCGIDNVIVDNLVPDVNGKKVTVGLADEGDAAIFTRKINGLYIDNQQIYVEDIRKKQDEKEKLQEMEVNEQSYSKPPKGPPYQNYYNHYESEQNTQYGTNYYMPQLQVQSAQNSSLTNYVNDASQPWQQLVAQSFGQNSAQRTCETNLLNYNFQQPYYETSFQFNQSSVPSNSEPSGQYFPSNNKPRIGNNSKLDRNTGSINQRQVPSNRYSPTQAFEQKDYNRERDSANTCFRLKRNNSSNDDTMHGNHRESNANARRSRRRSPSPKRQKMGGNYESNNFRNRSFERFSNVSRNDRSDTRDSFPRSSSRGSNYRQYGGPTESKVMANKSYGAPKSMESRLSTSSFYKPANINPWQHDFNPREDMPEARAQSTHSSNFTATRPFIKYETTNKSSKFIHPMNRSTGRNDARTKKFTNSNNNDKKDSLTNKDQTWRCQVTSQIFKTITRDQKIPSSIYLPKLLSQLKICIKSRIDMLLGDRFAVPPSEILSLYKNKFPSEEWPSLFNTVLESVKNSRFENWMPEKGTDTKVFKNESNIVNRNDKQPNTRAPNPDAFNKTSAGKVPKYPNADKNIYKQHKKITSLEYQGEYDYHLDPPLQRALDEELDVLIEEFKKGCEYPYHESERAFCDRIRDNASSPFKQIISLHLKKRLLDIHTSLVVRVFGTARKGPLIDFLLKYGVVSLKKSDTKKMYIAHIDSYKNYDKLCALEKVIIDGTTITIKPLNLIGPQKSNSIKYVNNSIELLNVKKDEYENDSIPDEKVKKEEGTSEEYIDDRLIKVEENNKAIIVETNIDTKIESESIKEGSVENEISSDFRFEGMTEIDTSQDNNETLTDKVNKTEDKKESPVIGVVAENNDTAQNNKIPEIDNSIEEDQNQFCDTYDTDDEDLEDY